MTAVAFSTMLCITFQLHCRHTQLISNMGLLLTSLEWDTHAENSSLEAVVEQMYLEVKMHYDHHFLKEIRLTDRQRKDNGSC